MAGIPFRNTVSDAGRISKEIYCDIK